jgi:hypothetical protein
MDELQLLRKEDKLIYKAFINILDNHKDVEAECLRTFQKIQKMRKLNKEVESELD